MSGCADLSYGLHPELEGTIGYPNTSCRHEWAKWRGCVGAQVSITRDTDFWFVGDSLISTAPSLFPIPIALRPCHFMVRLAQGVVPFVAQRYTTSQVCLEPTHKKAGLWSANTLVDFVQTPRTRQGPSPILYGNKDRQSARTASQAGDMT